MAVGVQHEDRVVLHRLDQQPEALLAVAQRLVRLALTGQVLHLHEHVERAVPRVAHRGQRGLQAPGRDAGEAVADLDDVLAPVHHTLQHAGETVVAEVGEVGVGPTHERRRLAVQELGEAGVGTHDTPRERERGHPDRRVVEHLPEAFDVLLEERLHVRVLRPLDARRARRAAAQHRGQLGGEGVQAGGLLQVRRGAQLEGAVGQPLLLEAGEHHDHGAGRGLAHQRQRLEPVHPRHRHVHQQQVGRVRTDQLDRLAAAGSLTDDLELLGDPQASADQGAQLRRVVDDNDRRSRARGGGRSRHGVKGTR